MNEQATCPECGKPLPEGSSHDLCPACLMGQVMASQTLNTMAGNEAAAPPPTPEEIADKFPQFEVVECLGRGGMGVVYKARQKSLDRWVAIKVLAPERVHEERFAEHFEREAKTLAKMSHPNIVTVFDHGQTDGLFYIVMEFVDGLNLRDLLREAKMEPEQALAIIPPICDALEYAHDKGVVHRDIKPENILLDREGRVKIADFGIASLVGASGEKSGTPPYMAPEQENGIVDRRADIYALGVVLYEMLTGERPSKELVAPSKRVQIDVRLDEIVLRALEKTPALRYQTAGEFRTVLETVAAPPAKSEVRSQEAEQIENLRKSANPPLLRGCVDYRSKTTLFGLPLLHVTSGVDPLTGRVLVAKGIIAIGDRAQGVVAFGGVAAGGLAFGGVAMGVIAFGGCAVGVVSFGGLAIALIAALGGGAIAPIAIGGGACGYLAFGGQGIGAHVLDSMTKDPVAEQFFLPWAKTLLVKINWILMPVLLLVVGIGVGVPRCFQRRNRSVANATGSAGGTILTTSPSSSAKFLHGTERVERCDPSRPLATSTDADGARQARILPFYHRPRRLRDCWPWDANFLSVVTAILASFPATIAACLMPVLGAKSLLFLILELIPLLYVVVYFSILRRVDRLRAKVTPVAREIAEGLFATRVLQTPCLAVLADDRLELLGVAGQPITIPLSDIEAVTAIRWFNGRRLWWKGCLKIERRSAPAIAIALAESVTLRWKPYLTGEVRQLELIPPKDRVSPSPEIQSCFSRTAIVGVCWLVFIPLHFLLPLIIPAGWQNNALIELLVMLQALLFWTAPLGVTILGWIAASQIRRSAGRLYGMWLAVFDGLLFPLLAVDAVMLAVPMMAMKLIPWQGMFPVYLMLLFAVVGLGLIAFSITANVFIVRRVWRAVNRNNSTAPQQTGSTDKPTRFSRKAILVAAYVCMALSLTVLFTKRWNERKREGVWVPARISNTIGQQYGDAQVRVVDVSQTGQVVVVSFTCEMFSPDHELRVQYGGPVLSYPNDLTSLVNAKAKDLDCLITPRAKLVGDNIGEVLAGTNALSGRTMFRVGFVLPDSQTAAQVGKQVQEVLLGKPHGLGEDKSVLLLFSLHRDLGKDAAAKPVVEALDATLWLRPKSNTTSAHMPGASSELSFGPVMERTIYDYKSGKEWLLNLKTGETFSLPPGLDWDRNASAVWQWAHKHGVHVTGLPVVSQRGLYGFEMKIALLRDKSALFETVRVDEITNAMKGNLVSASTHNGGPPLYQLWGNDWQSLFAFETDQGALGVLQVTGFTDNPPGVKLRYKLVRL